MKTKGLSFVLIAALLCCILTLFACSGEHTHTPGEWIVDKAPTCTEAGERQNKCTGCGEVVSTETVPATGHSYADGVCTACGAVDPEYFIELMAEE